MKAKKHHAAMRGKENSAPAKIPVVRRTPESNLRSNKPGIPHSDPRTFIFIAFSTANPGVASRSKVQRPRMLPNDQMNTLFLATVQATEEAIINALIAADTMTGINGNNGNTVTQFRMSG